jgi:hypothetical protein
MSKSKANRQIIPIEDVNFSKLKFEETKENEYINKNMHMSFANIEQADGTMTTLYFKTPQLEYNIGGLPPAKDKDGNAIEYKDGGRAKWRCYIGDSPAEKKMLEKLIELQDKMLADKSIIVGSKDSKKFDLEELIGETQTKEGETLSYARFTFRTEGPTRQIATKFFVRKDGIDEEQNIKTVDDIEANFRRGEFRYKMIVSLSKIWKLKATSKYGASFTIEQMQIEMRDDVVPKSVKNLFAKSQFDDSEENVTSVTQKIAEVDLSNNIEVEDDDVEEDEDEKEDIPVSKKSAKKKTAVRAKKTAKMRIMGRTKKYTEI